MPCILYRKYLAGFKSRKKLRKKAAQQQKSEREKRFQKEVKQEVIELHAQTILLLGDVLQWILV